MRNKVLYLQLCLLFIISSLPVQKAQAGEKDTPTEYNTPIYGEWSTKARSLSPIPFTASISGDQLTLKCASPDYDILQHPKHLLFPFLSTAYLKVVTRLKSAMITVVTYKVHFSYSYGKGETDL